MRAENFRLYDLLDWRPGPGLNLIVGSNAAGKTSLLEAAFVAARGRSFRAAALAELAGGAGKHWSVFTESAVGVGVDRAGMAWSPEGVELRLNGDKARLADMARQCPLQLIDPLAHRLVDEGPGYRRGYLDWGVFHVEHSFLASWQKFQRALKQRNQSLRAGYGNDVVTAWDAELVSAATDVTAARQRHMEALSEPFAALADRLLGMTDLSLHLAVGWPRGSSLADLLSSHLAQHRKMGTTLHGPHRAEVRIDQGDHRARGRLSRGQQKLLVAALVLAQCRILIDAGIDAPIVLVDDFSAELSTEYQGRLARELTTYPGQVFVTAFERPAVFGPTSLAMFHVEQGRLREAA